MAKIGFGLLYGIIGVAFGMILNLIIPGAGSVEAFLVGAMATLTLMGAHVLLTLRQRIRQQEVKLSSLRQDIVQTMASTRNIEDTISNGDDGISTGRFESLLGEVRILQSVIDRIVQGGKQQTLSPALPESKITPQTPHAKLNDREVMGLLQEAVRADRIEVFLQPIVSLPQRKLRFYEMFTRIRAPNGDFITPDRFVQLAEQGGVIQGIDNLQLLRCIQMIRDTEKRHSTLRFFCNISSETLRDKGFMTELVQFLGQNAILAPKLIFELAQADLATMPADLVPVLDGLGRLGCRFSMDRIYSLDFPLAALTARKIRTVKIDSDVLLAEYQKEGGDMQLRELKNQLDRNSIDLIVSKIESEGQLRELLDLNIDFGQGYLFGEPRANWPLS